MSVLSEKEVDFQLTERRKFDIKARGMKLQIEGVSDEEQVILSFIKAHHEALEGYMGCEDHFWGRRTAASNAVRSLHATITALWFDLYGKDL